MLLILSARASQTLTSFFSSCPALWSDHEVHQSAGAGSADRHRGEGALHLRDGARQGGLHRQRQGAEQRRVPGSRSASIRFGPISLVLTPTPDRPTAQLSCVFSPPLQWEERWTGSRSPAYRSPSARPVLRAWWWLWTGTKTRQIRLCKASFP